MHHHYVAWYHRHFQGFWEREDSEEKGERDGAWCRGFAVGLVPVAFASLSLLQEGPYEGVDNVGLVLLQPVAGSRNDVETEVVPDVEAARFGHLLLQERIPLPPQQQHRRPDVFLVQGEGADKIREKSQILAEITLQK